MKHLLKALFTTLFIGIIILFTSCNNQNSQSSSHQNFEDIILYQNNTEFIISKNTTEISITKNTFSLRFYNKRYDTESGAFYSAQIVAFLHNDELTKIKEGMNIQEIPCFEMGSGMAPHKSGRYESLIFSDGAHHYLVYENSNNKRLTLLEDKDEYLKLEFEINKLYYNDEELNLRDVELAEFYLAILIDRNLNGVIDKNELKKLIVKIE